MANPSPDLDLTPTLQLSQGWRGQGQGAFSIQRAFSTLESHKWGPRGGVGLREGRFEPWKCWNCIEEKIILLPKMWWNLLFRRIKKHNGGSLESAAAVQHQQEDHCGARQPHHLRRVQLAEDGDFAVQDVFLYDLDFFFRLRPTMSFGELEKMGLLKITTRWSVFSISCEILPCSTLCMLDRWISP